MKEFHIITVGTSIITNAQKEKIAGLTGKEKVSDENFWSLKLEDKNFLYQLMQFVNQKPRIVSAELNTFLRVVKNKNPEEISVYLISTKTKIGEICKIVLENYLKESGYNLFTGFEISGYFWETQFFNREFAENEFKKDISELVDRLIYVAQKKKEEGYRVFFNPTGGLKAHVISCAIAGFLTNSEVYYMNEEFKNVVFLPLLFYIPKGEEITLLMHFKNKKTIREKEYEEIKKRYINEIRRLEIYGLVEVENDNCGNPYQIKITNRGQFWIQQFLK